MNNNFKPLFLIHFHAAANKLHRRSVKLPTRNISKPATQLATHYRESDRPESHSGYDFLILTSQVDLSGDPVDVDSE
jgi:hypothetical protein